jgi:hypothetical protein
MKLSIGRVYRTDKEVVVEASMERSGDKNDIPMMQATIIITEKSDLPIMFQRSRIRKEALPFKTAPQE